MELIQNIIKGRYKTYEKFRKHLNNVQTVHSFKDVTRFSMWINGKCSFSKEKEDIIYKELGLSFILVWNLLKRLEPVDI